MDKSVPINSKYLHANNVKMTYIMLIVLIGWTVFWELSRQKFAAELRRENYKLWKKLDCPGGLLRRLIIRDGFELEFFLLTKKYNDELDQLLRREAEKLRLILLMDIFFMLLAIIVIFT